ncbi:MAG: 2TM domain-containing protein [Actinomycetota bacterium]|nr:2TM domain-containing protein [Actinomycetota bacterium]
MEPENQRPVPPGGETLREKAEKRVNQRVGLLYHIGTYVVVNAFLVVIWALTGAGYPWFLWVMAGWGVGLLINIVAYFSGSKGEAARERMLQKEMDRIKREQD